MSGWISVEERLPEPMAGVLVLHQPGSYGNPDRVAFGCRMPPMEASETRGWETDAFLLDRALHLRKAERVGPVTHWQPLPEPPQEGA